MTREQLLALFQVDSSDIVQPPGPFHGQPLYVAYFWFLYITGYTERERDGIVTFWIRSEDRVQFPQLTGRETVDIRQHDDGQIKEVWGE